MVARRGYEKRLADALGTAEQSAGEKAGTGPGDIDFSGSVDIADFLAVLAAWGPCTACPEDADGDDEVGITDLLGLLANTNVHSLLLTPLLGAFWALYASRPAMPSMSPGDMNVTELPLPGK